MPVKPKKQMTTRHTAGFSFPANLLYCQRENQPVNFRLDSNLASGIPTISVGISTQSSIHFSLKGAFTLSPFAGEFTGEWLAERAGDAIRLLHDAQPVAELREARFSPLVEENSFVLKNVAIGIRFHWERFEDQEFFGVLKLVPTGGGIAAINEIDIERYLESVISSEMSAQSSLNLLKAHAVTSRSWLLAQLERARHKREKIAHQNVDTETERIRWYEREEHTLFDVCADDHCQRYQGITRASTPQVRRAVHETCGVVLAYDGAVCDARYSKSCGGVTEEYHNVWEPVRVPYLSAIVDDESGRSALSLHLADESNACRWIKSSSPAFCNSTDDRILSQVLVNYDQETKDFFRWKVEYTQDELAELVYRRSGVDFGAILALEPVERGTSGRLVRLKIVGTKRTMIIGKELEIRRTLSPSHLYSSAIVPEAFEQRNGVPSRFVLHGAGWGHGVGLCQIGAAVMGERGYAHDQILAHYFPHSTLTKIY